ncbi:hypothetical protein KY290_010066 [Solanum tuberosum]|uniref:Reverse transcriptase n=1 Tax=Solanum tuberosum TaxID=4113 RepID=A0ABQ7VWV3_SOLTU|nr:hypothetical protein KY289_010448 [Solanum tuberosum]KAH0708592.1 hypothetical protein KY284_010019 [Solanum tuberosum]KAH0772929.1 hypothetical protein KY290_010066 [Solanum tuberosum]
MWTSHPDLIKIITDSWTSQSNILDAIPTFQKNVSKWNQVTFGNIFHKKRNLIKRIEGIQNSPKYAYNSFLRNLENELVQEYNYILRVEEEFWKLKSRVNWLNEGDANTRFFHTTTLNRRRRNKILGLQTTEGELIYNQGQIEIITQDFFKELFSSNKLFSKLTNPELEASDNHVDLTYLDVIPTKEEVKKTVDSFQPFKAPGPDGLHPFFYQKYWEVVGNSVTALCQEAFT